MINFLIILCLFNGIKNSIALRIEAPEKSDSDKEFIINLASRLFTHKNPLNISQYDEVSYNCRRDYAHYLHSLTSFDLWALQMYDASGHFSTGILRGNANSFGDYEECLSVHNEKLRIKGKHCYIEMQPHVNGSAEYLNYIRELVQSFEIIKSKITDPSHIFAHFSSIVYGICVPSSCTHEDVMIAAKTFLTDFTKNTGLHFDIQVTKEMCHEADDKSHHFRMNNGTKITIAVFLIIFMISIFSTYQDVNSKDKNQWLHAYSITRNYKSLVSADRSDDDVKVIHGIKFVTAILIFLCHKTVDSLVPIVNRTKIALKSSESSSIIVRICALYTDVFLMLSGVLVAYSITNRLMRQQRVNVVREYISRYLRIVPNIIVVMLTTAYILPIISYRTTHRMSVVDKPAELCINYGWRNLLMIQNWFKFEEMCNLHTHHIGTDFELFLFSPLLLILMHKSPRKGISFVVFLTIISTFLRFYANYSHNLYYFVPFSANLSTLIDTANYLYTLPTHRFTVYGIGLLLGFILRKLKYVKLKKYQIMLGNVISAISTTIIYKACVRMTGLDVEYDRGLHALYAAFAPILVCVPVSWLIFASQNGYRNMLIDFLQWKGFTVTTKLCYAFYLVQIPVFQVQIANRRDVRFLNGFSMVSKSFSTFQLLSPKDSTPKIISKLINS
ncbi:hypothetical protein ACKWTF_005310 [Chironomus riparius]